jgi:hypothetical protein
MMGSFRSRLERSAWSLATAFLAGVAVGITTAKMETAQDDEDSLEPQNAVPKYNKDMTYRQHVKRGFKMMRKSAGDMAGKRKKKK